jgi:hypothetical protein
MPKGRTLDRGPPGARTPVHVVGQIGPKRKLRPDGSLLCEDVPIARTGTMLYRPGEVPLQPPKRQGAAQVLYVTRDAATLFAPEVLGGIIGAPITNDHPPEDVTPQNWNNLAQGFVLDAWQGDGDAADIMFADLVVTNRGAIHKINVEGIREVSLGYSAEYEQTGDGEGRQHNIIPNHLALVERGRCGPRCAIGDRHPKEINMARTNGTNGGPRPRVRLNDTIAAFRQQLDEIEEQHGEGGEDDDDGVHVHVHMGDRTTDNDPGGDDAPRKRGRTDDGIEARVADIEQGMLQMNDTLQQVLAAVGGARTGDASPGDGGAPSGDSAALQTSFTQYLSQAEILVPGFKPAATFDSAMPRAKTVDAMCAGRRAVLTLLNAKEDGAKLLKSVTEDGFDITNADCATVATAFKAAATVKAAANNRSMTGDRMGVPANAAAQNVAPHGGMKRVSDADINAANAAYWAKQS